MKALLFPFSICILGFMACEKEKIEPSTYPFPDFSGKFLVQDTFYQRLIVFDSPSSSHLDVLPPAPQTDKIIQLEKIPNDTLQFYNNDTTAQMLLIVNLADSFKVSINQRGEVYWSDNAYFSPETVDGSVFKDSISLTIGRFNNYNGEYARNKYTGKRL